MSRFTPLILMVPLFALLGCEADSPWAPAFDPGQVPSVAADRPDALDLGAHAAARRLVRSNWPTAVDPGGPFYARINPDAPHVYTDGEWAVVAFYRDPSCIPAGFNLLTFFDAPGAFGCPAAVAGHSLWYGEIGAGAPKHVVSRGMGAVPVWFAPHGEMLEARADGILTIGEIEALPGLMKGIARQFHEVLQPHALPPELGGGGHPVPMINLNARGTLEDGRSFSVHLNQVDDGAPNVGIRIR